MVEPEGRPHDSFTWVQTDPTMGSPSKLVKYCAHPHGVVAARWNAPSASEQARLSAL
jgi:hypothetical protein